MNSQISKPNVDGIPQYMRENARFCFWKMQLRNEQLTKIPYNPKLPNSGAQTNNPETFGTLDQAMKAYQQYGGDGIGVLNDQGLWGIDIDHCVDTNGQLSEMAQDIIRTMNSPTEYSPRGGGVHIYFMAAKAQYSSDRYYINRHQIGLEVYPSGQSPKYLTVTGRHVEGTPEDISGDRSAEVIEILERYMVRDQPKHAVEECEGTSCLEDEDLLEKAFASKDGELFRKLWNDESIEKYSSHSEKDAALCMLLAFWSNKDAAQMDRLFRKSKLMREKWDRSTGAGTYGSNLIRDCIARCKNTYQPHKDVPSFIRIDGKGIPHVICPLLADHIRETVQYKLVRDSGKHSLQIYVYENGVYRLYAPDMFQGIIRDIIADYSRELVAMRDVKETYDQLVKDRNYIRQEDLNADESIINFRNGLLKISADRLELIPHDPQVLSTIQIPCDWIAEEQPTPVFDSFLNTLTNHTPDINRFLLEWIGLVISNIRGSRCKKALIMHGPGDTGKSILKSFAEHLLGKGNFIGIDLAEIEARFGTGAIFGTRLAGSSDMSYVSVSELKTFKKLTGGDSIFGEFKGQQGFEYVYGGLLWFCTNKPPKFGGDDGKWVYDRIMLLECPNVIPKEQQDKMLLDKLYTESEGIVCKAVNALRNVIRNGYCIEEPLSMQKARENYMHSNSSVISFFEECMAKRQDTRIEDQCTAGRVYKVYCAWCDDNDHGYAKTYREFREQLADYLGVSIQDLIIRRNNGTYLRSYTLTTETKLQYHKAYGYEEPILPLIGA